MLTDSGEKVCVLTRGYGRRNERERVLVSDGETIFVDARTGGDEPVELAGKLVGKAIVVADADRVSAAAWAKEKFGITAFVLDDGFQHRRARRDLDIVCIDATNPFGNGSSLSPGILREPLGNLRRSDAIVITRSELADNLGQLRAKIARLSPTTPIFVARSELADVESGSSVGLLDVGLSAFAFCGIGNPEAFFESVRRRGYKLKGTRAFPDHHYYTLKEFQQLKREAYECGANLLLTTWKDNVKLRDLGPTSSETEFEIPCYPATLVTTIDKEKEFRDLIISS
jgi:tetraacyldisaccharide 4'-kinase